MALLGNTREAALIKKMSEKGAMAAQGSRKYLLKTYRYSRNQFGTVTSSMAAFTKGLLKGWKRNGIAIGTVVGVAAILMTGSPREAQANVTCNYVGNAFDVCTDPYPCLPPGCNCLEGNLTASVTFTDFPVGYSGDPNLISVTANAPGFTLSCSGAQCDNTGAYFQFVRGKIVSWFYQMMQGDWPDTQYEIISSGPVSVPPPYGTDSATQELWGSYIYTGGINDSPGTWTCPGALSPPVASFTFFPPYPCTDRQITLDASSSYDPDGTIVKYDWDFGDGSTEEGGVIVFHAYDQPGQHTVTLTVTDNDGLASSTQRTIIVSSQGPSCGAIIITQPDLAGTWYFQVVGDSTSANSPLWGTGTMTVNLSGTVISGTVRSSEGVNDTLTGGWLTFDSEGQVVGNLHQGNGTIQYLPHGWLDPGKNILVMVNSSNGFRGLFIAVKGRGTFTQTDLAGTWYLQHYGDSPTANTPYWESGTIVVNANGDVNGGSAINDSGVVRDFTGGSLAIDRLGQFSGSLMFSDGQGVSVPHGKLDAEKTNLTMVASDDPANRGLFVATKGGGTFTQVDLFGTWYFQHYGDSTSANAPYWESGTMTVSAIGTVIGGTVLNDSGVIKTVTGGSLTIDSAGQVAGTMNLSDDTIESFPHGKLDAGKSILTLVSSDSGFRGLFLAAKGSGTRGMTFLDIPPTHFAHPFIEQLYAAGITGGCMVGPPPSYCPEDTITRGQMAVFMETSLQRSPSATCTGMFSDVNARTVGDLLCRYIEDFAAAGITGGCGSGNFCPNNPVTRAQMAVFIEAALQATPAASCTGTFSDVNVGATGDLFCKYIEDFAIRGITGGCGPGLFCPDDPVTRAQMAVFLVAAPPPLNP